MVEGDCGSHIVFGGFVNGSRRNDVYSFTFDGKAILWTKLSDHNPENSKDFPVPRSSHCAGFSKGKMFIIGGEDEDHTKLNDFWSFDAAGGSWTKI